MEKIRVGIVGLGGRGRGMLYIVEQFDEAECVAACDIRSKNWFERLGKGKEPPMSEKFPNANFYESYEEMLDKENLDLVLVETGGTVHTEFCVKALEKNINVLTDIPVVASLEEAEMLWKAHLNSTAMISIGANPNEQKYTYMLKDFYKSGKLGKPYYMEAEYLHPIFPDSKEAVQLVENGAWRNEISPIRYCTHSIGPLLTVVEEELRYVSCFGTGRHADEKDYMLVDNMDDMNTAIFRTESGISMRILRNGRCRALKRCHSYRVFGTEGYIERIAYATSGIPTVIRYNSTLDNDEALHEVSGEFMLPEYTERIENGKLDRSKMHDGMDFAMVDHVLKAIINGDPAPISLKEGLEMTLPGIYAEESARRGGQLIYMRYPWDEDWSTEIK